MIRKHLIAFFFLSFCFAFPISQLRAQETPAASQGEKKAPTSNMPEVRTKDGKRLLGALDLMKVAVVAAPRISPDASRVAYTVAEVKMEKDKEWKTVTQVWVVAAAGGNAMHYTRGDKSSTAPEWSPDARMLGFLSDREKDRERQVWLIMAEGGEGWAATTHKGGVSGFRWSPDSKQLLLSASDQPSKDEEDRKKVKDDTIVIDRDIRMTHLWTWNLETKAEKRLTGGEFTVSEPQWSPDGTRMTYTTRPTPKADDGALSDLWILTLATAEKKKLVDTASSDTARWSPDGQWIAYTGVAETTLGPTTTYLYLTSAAGGPPRPRPARNEREARTAI
jgi:Tol biopolymer transport system component